MRPRKKRRKECVHMTRKFLEELGLEKEAIDAIMQENGKDVNKAKGDYADLKAEHEEAVKTIESLKVDNADNEALLEKIKAHEKQIEALKTEATQKDFTYRLEDALKANKAKNLKAVKSLLDVDKLSIEGEEIKGLKEQLEALKTSDSYLFDVEATPQPLKVGGVVPTNEGKSPRGGITKEQFQSMGYKERMQLFTENKALYDELTQ